LLGGRVIKVNVGIMVRYWASAAFVAVYVSAGFSPAWAKEKPATPVAVTADPSWQGFYSGANGGYMMGAAKLADGSTDTGVNGAIAGVQFGYDWQNGSTVYGLAADYDFSNASRDFGSYKDSHSYVASLHGRFGQLLAPDVLVYALGGLTFSDVKDTASGLSDTQQGWGYTVGAGIEKLISHRTSVFAEYRYDYLNKVDFSGSFAGNSAICDGNELRVGINFRF
jgi:outer membrane immunogenic protein